MVLIQFQVVNFESEELQQTISFCKWLLDNIILYYIIENSNTDKIKIRINKLQEVEWIKWKKNKKIKLKYDEIINAITKCIIIKKYRNNVYKIETNENVLIPNTYTSIDRLIRYINSGDNELPATNIFTDIKNKLNYMQLNSYWKFFISNELGYFTDSKLNTQII